MSIQEFIQDPQNRLVSIQEFIQDPQNRLANSKSIEELEFPVINLSPLFSIDPKPSDIETIAREIGSACRTWGFFQIINHQVPTSKLEEVQHAAISFFSMKIEEKRKYNRDVKKHLFGFFDDELTNNVKDWKQSFDCTVDEPTIFPTSNDPLDKELTEWKNSCPPQLRGVCEDYGKEMKKLAFQLMELIALSLELPTNRFASHFREHTSYLRFNWYPPCPFPDLALGVGGHKDADDLVILWQDEVGGLEVKRKSDERWVKVKPIPSAFIINIGNIIQGWTNGIYKSVEHRVVVNLERERLSIPFFFNPVHSTIVTPMEELLDEYDSDGHVPYNWGKFVTEKRMRNHH